MPLMAVACLERRVWNCCASIRMAQGQRKHVEHGDAIMKLEYTDDSEMNTTARKGERNLLNTFRRPKQRFASSDCSNRMISGV